MASSSSNSSSTLDNIDATTLQKWFQEDLSLIDDEKGWNKPKKQTKDGITVFGRRSNDSSPVECFKVVGEVRATAAELRDLLHERLLQRQHEWHKLFAYGQILESSEGQETELCYMQYKSPSFFISPRDCIYIKHCKDDLSSSNGETGKSRSKDSFILCYRSLEQLHVSEPTFTKEAGEAEDQPLAGCVRTVLMQAAHLVEPLNVSSMMKNEQSNESDDDDGRKEEEAESSAEPICLVTSLQQAAPGGKVPIWLSNMTQPSIIIEEFQNMRKAVELYRNKQKLSQ